jgi:RNA polymerase sigma-70 factor (ECF subfamily)
MPPVRLYDMGAEMETALVFPIAAERAVAADEFADLVGRARRLDSAAWDTLYNLAFPQVYRYVAARVPSRHDAEDVTEEVFVGALQSVRGLKASDEAGFLAWLFQIARYKLTDRLRQHYRRPTEPLDPALDVADDDPTPEEAAIRQDAGRAVRAALADLTPEQRDVIVMKYVLYYDNAKAAGIMGKSSGAINQLQHRALAQLRKILTKRGA